MDRIRAWRQRPLAYWAVAAVLVLATAVAVVGLLGEARRAKAAYGQTIEVPVARRELPPGTVIRPADLERRALPRAVVPPGAGPVDAVVGRTVRWLVLPGEVVVDGRLADGLSAGPAALLPAGTVGLAVPAGRGVPPLAVGAPVAVVAAGDGAVVPAEPRAAGGGSNGTDRAGSNAQDGTVVDGAGGAVVDGAGGAVVDGAGGAVVEGTVVALDAAVATIAVPIALAPRLVAALARGDLAVVLRRP